MQDIYNYEYDKCKILSQCGCNSNLFYADFRSDLICASYNKFTMMGLNLDILLNFQQNVHNVIYPWNKEYDSLRQNVNRRFNIFPLIIVMAETEEDVINAFYFAKTYKIDIKLRSGAHCFENFSLGEGMVIDQSQRQGIKIYSDQHIAEIESGVLEGPLINMLINHGVFTPIGTCVNVGMVPYSIGGGLGPFTRYYGTGSDNIIELKVLLADGRVINANKNQYSDLYWAFRGAGNGTLGIVLSMKIQLYPCQDLYFYELEYIFNDIRDVIRIWLSWAPYNPPELLSHLKATNGKGPIQITGFYLGTCRDQLIRHLQPLLQIGSPILTIKPMSMLQGITQLFGTGRWLPFFKGKNAFVDQPFPEESLRIIQKYMSLGDGRDHLVIDCLGGVHSKISPTSTAFPHRNSLAWLVINSHWEKDSERDRKLQWTSQFYQALQPYLSERVYANTPDLDLDRPLQRYYGENLSRLIQIKRKYDPQNIFKYEQSIPLN